MKKKTYKDCNPWPVICLLSSWVFPQELGCLIKCKVLEAQRKSHHCLNRCRICLCDKNMCESRMIQCILPLWPIFMNENRGWYFTVIPSIVAVSPSLLPWFVYSNLLQNVSRSFINPTHLTWHSYSCTLYAQTYLLSTHRKLRPKFEIVLKTPELKTSSCTN